MVTLRAGVSAVCQLLKNYDRQQLVAKHNCRQIDATHSAAPEKDEQRQE